MKDTWECVRERFKTLAPMWSKGRQVGGYDILPLFSRVGVAFDVYIIRYRQGTNIPPHTDPVPGKRHYRLNFILWNAAEGGKFVCDKVIFKTKRIKVFRPDLNEHSVTEVTSGSRYVFSVGWAIQ